MILTLCSKPIYSDLRFKGRVNRYESYGSFSCFDKQQKQFIKEQTNLGLRACLVPLRC